MGGSKPESPPKPDPATQATTTSDLAKRRAELERRKRSGYYKFHNAAAPEQATTPTGGNQQTVG